LQADATYLIAGGLGALGLQVAQWFVGQGARHLVLVSRREVSPAAEKAIALLCQTGVQVEVARADIADPAAMSKVFKKIERSMPPLKGIVHAAGILDDGLLLQQNWERFWQVMKPKVAGAWNLHRLTLDLPLDFFVCFSSMAAVLGNPGQANYAAANAFIDALARYRQGLGLPGLSINWGPWSGNGMAANIDWMETGITPLEPEQGMSALQLLLGQQVPQLAVMKVDWQRYRWKQSLLSKLTRAIAATHDSTLLEKLQAALPLDCRETLMAHVTKEVSHVLGFAVSELADPHQRFFDLGMDSLMAVNLKNRLASSLNLTLPATLIFEFPTIDDLTNYLLGEISKTPIEKMTFQVRGSQQLPPLELVNDRWLMPLIDEELAELETLLEGNEIGS
jgi:acyl carrier protein